MRTTATLLTLTLVALAPAAHADEPPAPTFTPSTVPEAAPAWQPTLAPAPSPGTVVMSSSHLRCDACIDAELAGVALFGVGEAGAGLHMISIWARPLHTATPDNDPLGVVAMMDGVASLAIDLVSVLELVPVGGPLLGALIEREPSIQRLMLVDAGVQTAGLLTAAVSYHVERNWKAQVVPLVATRATGVMVAGNF